MLFFFENYLTKMVINAGVSSFFDCFCSLAKKEIEFGHEYNDISKREKSIASLKPLNYNKKWSNEQEQTKNNQK